MKRGYYNCYKQVVQGSPVAHIKGDPPYNNFAQGPKYARAGPVRSFRLAQPITVFYLFIIH